MHYEGVAAMAMVVRRVVAEVGGGRSWCGGGKNRRTLNSEYVWKA